MPLDSDFPSDKARRVLSNSSSSSDPEKEKNYGWRTDPDALFNGDAKIPRRERPSSAVNDQDSNELTKSRTKTLLGGKIKLRAQDDEEETDWWFASTAIPLLSATFAPMANMLSIAALVVYWRNDITTPDNHATKFSLSVGTRDPQWCLNLNGASLACGFVGNIFLLCNFTKKIRYIIALPMTILLFYVAAGILMGITIGMNVYTPPTENQVYSQGYWHAVIAACLYMVNAMLLMVNMLGYFLGHYPQHFDITDEQRNLILQTMIFFLWLAGGAGLFARLEGDNFPGGYSDALYFCDVTLLTIGFGDFYATDDLGRGLVFPYTVGGTIILGLMVSSIHKFAQELSKEKVIKKHIETRRVHTLKRAISFHDSPPDAPEINRPVLAATISRPLEADQVQHHLDEKATLEKAKDRVIGFHTPNKDDYNSPNEPSQSQFHFKQDPKSRSLFRSLTLDRVTSLRHRVPALLPNRSQKAILMRNEKDRFDKMRDIQFAARRFKKWYALVMSAISFGLLWCVGAAVFYCVESETQGLSYFQALYFCYVSLLTIGYGDLSPRSNAGKPFFIFWSLIAVPTMTILVSDLGDTAIGGFKRKVLEYGGLAFLGKGRGWGLDWLMQKKQGIQRRFSMGAISHDKAQKLEAPEIQDGLAVTGGNDGFRPPKDIEDLMEEELTEAEMTRRLAYALQRVADDMKYHNDKRYSYEEWAEFTRLVRFSRLDRLGDTENPAKLLEEEEAVQGLIEWDWLDHNSPMTSEQSEAEWVMDRLLESLLRTFQKSDILARLALSNSEGKLLTPTPADTRARRNSFARDLSPGEDDSPQWSKRGKARKGRRSSEHERSNSRGSGIEHSAHRPTSKLHGRMAHVVKRPVAVFQRRPKSKSKDDVDPG